MTRPRGPSKQVANSGKHLRKKTYASGKKSTLHRTRIYCGILRCRNTNRPTRLTRKLTSGISSQILFVRSGQWARTTSNRKGLGWSLGIRRSIGPVRNITSLIRGCLRWSKTRQKVSRKYKLSQNSSTSSKAATLAQTTNSSATTLTTPNKTRSFIESV